MSRSERRSDTGRDSWPRELEDLYRSRRTELVRMGYLMVGDAAVAEELTQEAFLATAPKMHEIAHPFAYVRAAVANGARDWLRRQSVRARVDRTVAASVQPALQQPDELWDALATLEERRRVAIVLRYYVGLPDDETAEILDCAVPTVRTLIRRGLADLRKEIDR